MSSPSKNYTEQLKRKPTSHTKLPRITPMAPINEKNTLINQFVQRSKHNLSPIAKVPLKSLYDKRGISMVANKIVKSLTQQNEQSQTSKHNSTSAIKLQLVQKQGSKLSGQSTMPSSKLKITEENTRVLSQRPQSAGSSRTSLHPVVNQIQHLISQQAKSCILPVKSHKQNAIGDVSALWWSVVDSLFYSLQKILKVKQTQPSNQKAQSRTDQRQKSKTQKESPNKTVRDMRQSPEKQKKKIYGIVQSNTKVSIQVARVYGCLQQQNMKNETTILRYYEDPSHITLVLEAFFFEKIVIYLLASLRKWCHEEELLLIHSLAIENIACIVQCRRLLMDILIQGVENEQQDNKIRKPKYIARQKKLIQISKFIGMMKSEYEKYIYSLGSPNRYKSFNLPDNLRDHASLLSLQTKWRNLTLDVPIPPYIQDRPNKKEYLVVVQPLNLLYKYNKKQESLQIDPYAQLFLKKMTYHFDIVFFTAVEKQSSLLNFLGILENSQILYVLDKHYLTYLAAKPIKNISKIGGGYSKDKVLVLDEKANAKYYTGCLYSVLLVEGSHNQTKIARVNGKLVRMDDHDQDYLNNLSSKIINCAIKGGHWSQIISDKSERRK